MLTITDIRALAKNRFDCRYEKWSMIVAAIFIAWILIALACQSFTSSEKDFVYSVPDSAIKMTGNEVYLSSFSHVKFNDYNLSTDDSRSKNVGVFLGLGVGFPFVAVLTWACVYSYKKDRYTMVFQQKWLETGLVPDTDKI